MENSLRIIVIGTLLMAVLSVVSCSKHEGFESIRDTPVSVENSSWSYLTTKFKNVWDTTLKDSIRVDSTSYRYVVFGPDLKGLVKMGYYSQMKKDMKKDTVINIKYTYTKPTGTIVYRAFDKITDQWKDEEQPFTVNGMLLNITLPLAGPIECKRNI